MQRRDHENTAGIVDLIQAYNQGRLHAVDWNAVQKPGKSAPQGPGQIMERTSKLESKTYCASPFPKYHWFSFSGDIKPPSVRCDRGVIELHNRISKGPSKMNSPISLALFPDYLLDPFLRFFEPVYSQRFSLPGFIIPDPLHLAIDQDGGSGISAPIINIGEIFRLRNLLRALYPIRYGSSKGSRLTSSTMSSSYDVHTRPVRLQHPIIPFLDPEISASAEFASTLLQDLLYLALAETRPPGNIIHM